MPLTNWTEDKDNPHNWPPARKYTVTILLSALSFNTLMSSTMVAPGLGRISDDLGISDDSRTQLVLSIYVLAYAAGYFFWAPLSEVYGRKRILEIANIWFFIWNLVCGFAQNEATITVARLFSGAGAAASMAVSLQKAHARIYTDNHELGTGSMGEIWQPRQRGRSLAILSTITLLGPCIGPILGGVIAEHSVSSWRWAFWSTSIFNLVLQLLCFRLLHESHAQTILRCRDKCKPDQSNLSQIHQSFSTSLGVLTSAFRRPFFLLFTQPASQGLIIYSGLQFGTLYIFLSTLTQPFTDTYDQSLMVASLNYISFGIGQTLGAQVCAPITDALYRRRANRVTHEDEADFNKEKAVNMLADTDKSPELRIYPMIPALFLASSGLLLFGWSIHFKMHWIVPDIGMVLFSAGGSACVQCINAYMIDTFSNIQRCTQVTATPESIGTQPNINWSASAMASLWAIKSLGGFAFPLFSIKMFNTLGWGWSGSLLALLNIAVGLPVTIVLVKYGSRLRTTGRRRIEAGNFLG